MDENLYRLAYCSRNTIQAGADSAAELGAILDVSRRNNARDGLTGALLFSDGAFGQIIEGEYRAVERVFEHIQNDERHGDVVVLTFEPVAHRSFGPWAMAHIGAGTGPGICAGTTADAELGPVDEAGRDLIARLRGILVNREQQPPRV